MGASISLYTSYVGGRMGGRKEKERRREGRGNVALFVF